MYEANFFHVEWSIKNRLTGEVVAFGEALAINTEPNLELYDSFGKWNGLDTVAGDMLGHALAELWAEGTPYDDPDDDFNLETTFTGEATYFTPEEWKRKTGKVLEQMCSGGKVILGLFKYSI